jgi:deoxyribodipyrimidine photo-lyase
MAPLLPATSSLLPRSRSKEAADAFVEEVVVRRELADNFAEYTPDDYDK